MLNKKALVLLAFIIGSVYTQTEAQQAAGILTSLVRESEANLQDLDNYWKVNFPILKGMMDAVQEDFNALEQECFARKDQISNTDQESDNSQHYIEWIGQKVQDNLTKIEILEDAHCESSKLYVNGLKHNKIALSLIAFMRQAIQDKESLSLLQRRSIIGQLSVFFQMYSKDQYKGIELLQQDYTVDTSNNSNTEARTNEQIGTGHIDENGDQIEVDQFESRENKSWPEYKAELLALLNSLETDITAQVDSAQDNQIDSGVSLADWKIKLESENQELDRHLAQEAERIGRLAARKVREEAYYDECIDEINIIFETLLQTRSEYDEKVYAHEDKRSALVEEVEIFQYVEKMYTDNVEVDGTYNEREVDNFSILN